MASLGYIGYAFSTQIVHFYIFSLVIGIGGAMSTSVPLQAIINNWFSEKKGAVLGIVLSGVGIGGVICTTLSNILINNFGLAIAYLILGVFMLVISLPTALFLILQTPDILRILLLIVYLLFLEL